MFQRGNKRQVDNAIIRYSLSQVLNALCNAHAYSIAPSATNRINLGSIEGVPFCFTDKAALSNGDMVFCALAEDTEDANNEGFVSALQSGSSATMDTCYPCSNLTGHSKWRASVLEGAATDWISCLSPMRTTRPYRRCCCPHQLRNSSNFQTTPATFPHSRVRSKTDSGLE
ncbi:hypothetical protein NOJ05_00305 [Neorhizobium galegae]|uniref:DUF6910 family protein n=1 Tax=Neorhizobium galegae TaxID=399 RepID=UPI0021072B26|nr:hypothetical protein [Neorhizobium galegae]MCQ1775641.1 hypothetical protein [Neorhizobium galegae]MCQ1798090.1 hypothetical protein [Neorhizobium galegae]